LDRDISIEIEGGIRLLPTLLNYFEQTKESVDKCQKIGLDNDLLKALFLAWQWKKSYIKAKKTSRRDKEKWEKGFYLEYAQDLLSDEFERVKETIFDELDNIIKASSEIENINSILQYLSHFSEYFFKALYLGILKFRLVSRNP
jgi:thiaminase